MFRFKIVKPEGVVYDDQIDKLTIPTTTGQITILENHAPLVSVVATGEMIITKNKYPIELSISGGVLEITSAGEVFIMADSAERAEEIDIERAERARQRAEELIKQQKDVEDIEFAKIQAVIEREMNRIKLGKKYKKLNIGK